MTAAEAARASRDLARPQKPEDYKFGLSEGFKPPQGVEFKLNADDPMVTQYRALAHEFGLDQSQFSKGLDLLAAVRLGEDTQFKTAKAAEVAKLGVNGTARVDAVTRWMTAVAGDQAKALVGVLEMAPVASTIEAFETLINKVSNQGGIAFSQANRAPPAETGKIAGYERMTFEQRRLAQDQRRTNAAR